jgi:hypothetical protein
MCDYRQRREELPMEERDIDTDRIDETGATPQPRISALVEARENLWLSGSFSL